MPTRILWVARHPPIPKQLQELRRVFGEIELHIWDKPVKNADHLHQLKQQHQADEMVLVLPLWIIYHYIKKYRDQPIWAQMQEVPPTQPYDISAGGRFYRFIEFRRIIDIKLETIPLKPRTKP